MGQVLAVGALKGVKFKNQLEARYGQHLELRLRAREIVWWRYEGIKFRLADGAFYTPDFPLMLPDGRIEIHETKGFWREAAKVRIKVAAEQYPFRFVAVTEKGKGNFIFEEF